MANIQEFYYPSVDGVHQVHAVLWLPDDRKPKGIVQLVHGICEYALRYDHFARYLTENGYMVMANDHLGHGKTVNNPEEYGYFTEWTDLVRDVRTLQQKTHGQVSDLPYFMLGHSMGSFVTRTYLIDYPDSLTGAILSGTGQESVLTVAAGKLLTGLGDPHKVNRLFYKLSLGAYNQKFSPARTTADWICRDEKVVDTYLADPLCNFPIKAGMNHAMMCGLQYIGNKQNLAKMNRELPIYFFAGDQDPVGAMGEGVKKVARWFREVGMQEVTVKLYSGGRHEMLNEINKAEVYQDVLMWLDTHLPKDNAKKQ